MSFYKSIAPFYHHVFPIKQAQVDFVQQAFSNKSMSYGVLDVGCGIGGLLQELDKTYKSVSGLDLDREMIQLAKQRQYLHKPNIVLGSMLQINQLFEGQCFDGVICFGNTIVHLTSEDGIKAFLKLCYDSLMPGGVFLLQLINYDKILDQQLDALPTIENEEIKFVRHYDYFAALNKINFRTELTIKKSGQQINNEQLLTPVRSSVIVESLKEVGFKNINLFGDFRRAAFNSESIPLILEVIK